MHAVCWGLLLFQVGYWEKFLLQRAVGHWHRLPREVGGSLSLEGFQNCGDVALRVSGHSGDGLRLDLVVFSYPNGCMALLGHAAHPGLALLGVKAALLHSPLLSPSCRPGLILLHLSHKMKRQTGSRCSASLFRARSSSATYLLTSGAERASLE